jgi:hypothetical protein
MLRKEDSTQKGLRKKVNVRGRGVRESERKKNREKEGAGECEEK